MPKPINIFLPADLSNSEGLRSLLVNNPLINKVFYIHCGHNVPSSSDNGILRTNSFFGSDTFNTINRLTDNHDLILITDTVELNMNSDALFRLLRTAQETAAGIISSDHFEQYGAENTLRHVLPYHSGSVRDDFYFGPVLYFNHIAFDYAVMQNKYNLRFAGLYDLRLRISEKLIILNIPEYLYSIKKSTAANDLTEKHFNYVDPKNRDVQIEMEKVFTDHLIRIGAHVDRIDKRITPNDHTFDVEASVIIPVKDRVKTIDGAVSSALRQNTDFPFNIIVVDNHSTDGTSELLNELSNKNKLIKHIIPKETGLGIGGCWNEAVNSAFCGRYSIQLDSDDLYKDESTLQKIVNLFRKEQCAMVIGSYTITDFNLNTIPPGIIDHSEWTDENGMNNALRINGLGAPRAFYTPVLRQVGFPNVSYGEDYAVALRISAEYKVGRIYEPIYLCRRWEGNSDHNISYSQQDKNNSYKDFIRRQEIITRQNRNKPVE